MECERCRRIIKPSGQMVITVITEQTMKEFYALFQTILKKMTRQAE